MAHPMRSCCHFQQRAVTVASCWWSFERLPRNDVVNSCVNSIVDEISIIADEDPVSIKKEQLHGVVEIVWVNAMLVIDPMESNKG